MLIIANKKTVKSVHKYKRSPKDLEGELGDYAVHVTKKDMLTPYGDYYTPQQLISEYWSETLTIADVIGDHSLADWCYHEKRGWLLKTHYYGIIHLEKYFDQRDIVVGYNWENKQGTHGDFVERQRFSYDELEAAIELFFIQPRASGY